MLVYLQDGGLHAVKAVRLRYAQTVRPIRHHRPQPQTIVENADPDTQRCRVVVVLQTMQAMQSKVLCCADTRFIINIKSIKQPIYALQQVAHRCPQGHLFQKANTVLGDGIRPPLVPQHHQIRRVLVQPHLLVPLDICKALTAHPQHMQAGQVALHIHTDCNNINSISQQIEEVTQQAARSFRE